MAENFGAETMIERVARVLTEHEPEWDNLGRAKAVLAAMREPTDEMLVAGLLAGNAKNRPFADKLREKPKAFAASLVTAGDGGLYRSSYTAMIDAALST